MKPLASCAVPVDLGDLAVKGSSAPCCVWKPLVGLLAPC